MDVLHFFNQRIEFIEQLYKNSSSTYVERKRKIEAEEEPYEPPYSEEVEPAFLDEWLEADESLHVLAYSCLSMLTASLHLYLETWVSESRLPIEEPMKQSIFKKRGWFVGYKTHFSKHFSINFECEHSDFELLEEIVLARNCIEHPSRITSQRAHYLEKDLKKIKNPFFVDKREADHFLSMDVNEQAWFISPTLHINEEKLLTVISEVKRFTMWFEDEITKRIYGTSRA